MMAGGIMSGGRGAMLMLQVIDPISPAKRRHVLVVDDDQVSRTFLRISLQKNGCTVLPVATVAEAQAQLTAQGFEHFDCVISDYWMAENTGLDLVDWLKTKDATLAVIIATGECEKALVAESLRRGVTDFLEKPVRVPKLLAAVTKAVAQTEQHRRLSQSATALESLGRTQRWMVQSGTKALGKLSVEVSFQPKLEAGGDFFGHFQISPEKHCCLLTDVSGHDLQAAYISAYFHGIFRGMLSRSSSLPEIFGYFNDFLVNEWNQAEQLQTKNSFGTSLAAVAVLIDSHQQVANVFICGAPVPVYVSPDGRAQDMSENDGPPLGWFPDIISRSAIYAINGGGTIFLWTDGLADLAIAQQVHPFCLAYALQRAKEQSVRHPLLQEANDDILFAAIQLTPNTLAGELFQPLVVDTYRGDQGGEIDALEAAWRRNLKLALPELGEPAEHDIVLAMREAALNAFKHGCLAAPEKDVRLQINYHRARRVLQVRVEDPGDGHDFDCSAHLQNPAQDLLAAHRGLFFIVHLAQHVKFERNGATIIMEFHL